MSSKFVDERVAENSCPSFHSELTPTNFTFMLTISRFPFVLTTYCACLLCESILRKLRFCLALYDGCIAWQEMLNMENTKPKCIYQEERWTRALITIDNLPDDFVHLQVSNHSKIRNMLGFALKSFEHSDHLVCSASGPSVNKAVTCAEILKRQMPELRQITGIGYRNVRMVKDEMTDGKISQTITTRRLPSIHILLSKNHLQPNLSGYQEANDMSNHANRPVARKTFDKSEYRGTKENKVMSL